MEAEQCLKAAMTDEGISQLQPSKVAAIAKKLGSSSPRRRHESARLGAFVKVKKAIDDMVDQLPKAKAGENQAQGLLRRGVQLQTEKKDRVKEDLIALSEDLELTTRDPRD